MTYAIIILIRWRGSSGVTQMPKFEIDVSVEPEIGNLLDTLNPISDIQIGIQMWVCGFFVLNSQTGVKSGAKTSFSTG